MWLWILPGLLLLGGLLAWELWICEGAHLGRRFVVAMYDWAAGRYDRIKRFDSDWERRFLGEPVATALGGVPDALVLDAGAGTGRLARALAPLPFFRGVIVGLEPSRRMLAIARSFRCGPARWARGWSSELPFPAECFDLVASLEVLEFTPRPRETLRELVRVLRPGGWLLVTNRVGRLAPWILGHTWRRLEFPQVLESCGLDQVEQTRWQVEYDLVWARKRSRAGPA